MICTSPHVAHAIVILSLAHVQGGLSGSFDNFVNTPHGLWPRDCVHRVPSGTVVESLGSDAGGVRHIFPNGTTRILGPCKGRPLRRTRLQTELQAAPPGGFNDSVAVAHYPAPLYSTPQSYGALKKFTAKYVVPEDPKDKAGQSIYIWIGTDPDDESNVMQPVLGWNKQGGADPSGPWYGKGGWGIESWLMVPSGHSHYSETIWGLQPGDVVGALMVAEPSVGSNAYEIVASAQIDGKPVQTVLHAVGPIGKMEHLSTAEFEVWNECADAYCRQVYCDRMPSSQVVIYDMDVDPPSKFYSTRGLVWDLQERCAWTKTLQQPSLTGKSSWTLKPPQSPTPPSPPSPPTPPPPPSPPSPACPQDAQTVAADQGTECLWQNGTHGLVMPQQPKEYCEYLSQGYLGYFWDVSEGDYECAQSATKSSSATSHFCLWQKGQKGFTIPSGAFGDCGRISKGVIGLIFPSSKALVV